jgi:hypothetical protein
MKALFGHLFGEAEEYVRNFRVWCKKGKVSKEVPLEYPFNAGRLI